jgi:predicted nucleic acid-binding protein
MPVKAFLDTNVLIYAVSKDDSRTAVAEELLVARGVLGGQILNEFVSVARRQMLMSSSDVYEALDAFVTLCPSPPHHYGEARKGAQNCEKIRI